MQYYSAIKKNKLFIYNITWINLKIIMLGESSHTKDYIPYDFIYMKFWKGQSYSDSRSMVAQGLEVRMTTKEYEGTFWGNRYD